MREVRGNIWHFYSQDPYCIACVTTNGVVKRDGEAVMGAGVALEAARRWPWLPKKLGEHIQQNGNVLMYLEKIRLVTFPTKHEWYRDSDPELICKSALALTELAHRESDTLFYLPRPGCRNGNLNWEEVRLLLEPILPLNVVTITR